MVLFFGNFLIKTPGIVVFGVFFKIVKNKGLFIGKIKFKGSKMILIGPNCTGFFKVECDEVGEGNFFRDILLWKLSSNIKSGIMLPIE